MPETYTVTKAVYKGQKDNPHGGVLHKFYVSLREAPQGIGTETPVHDDVYWQRKSEELHEGQQVYGHIEDGEYGPRFKTDPRPDGSGSQGSSGGTFTANRYERVPESHDDRSWSIERQVAAKCAAQVLAGYPADDAEKHLHSLVDAFHAAIRKQPDADLGGGPKSTEASPPTADVSADAGRGAATDGEGRKPAVSPASSFSASPGAEASPAQKARLTKEFGKANLSRDAMKAVVLFRCRSEKATKDGASKLIQDLMDGATHDTLLAEIHDAKRAGDPLAVRAAKLIPSDTPLAEPEPEVVEEPNGESIPF